MTAVTVKGQANPVTGGACAIETGKYGSKFQISKAEIQISKVEIQIFRTEIQISKAER
ncbi:MAG: hypothetical protein FWH22_07505 [Fibromonadales bacterium]|nr:hypothetical protein [Fibromonadales bacterium]